MSDPHPDLVVDTLDVHATDEEGLARLAAYGDAWSRGFHEGGMDEDKRRRWLAHSRADDVVLRAAWPRVHTGPAAPVATFTSWEQQVNVGDGTLLDLHMITDVTVAPTHRRRGLLQRLMTEDLADAAARGLPLAALTVSEGGIYGRFGFGVATRMRRVEVDLGPRFALRHLEDAGSLELLEPAQAYPEADRVWREVLAATRGQVARPAFYEMIGTAAFDWDSGGADRATRVALHRDAEGRVDGYVRYRVKQERDGLVQVRDLQSLTPTAYLRLWRFVADLDLVALAEAVLRLDDPLEAALVDPRAVTTTGLRDFLWLRVLDPVAALEARPWAGEGRVVLEVADRHGWAAGRFAVEAEGGRAVVARTDAPADVHLDAETLGALYLGDRAVATHAAAGRVTGPGLARFAALADHAGPAPHCTTGF